MASNFLALDTKCLLEAAHIAVMICHTVVMVSSASHHCTRATTICNLLASLHKVVMVGLLVASLHKVAICARSLSRPPLLDDHTQKLHNPALLPSVRACPAHAPSWTHKLPF